MAAAAAEDAAAADAECRARWASSAKAALAAYAAARAAADARVQEARAAADEQLTSDDVLHDPFFLSVAALAALADAQVEGGVRVGFADGRVLVST